MRKIRLYDESAQAYHRRYHWIQQIKYQAVAPHLQEGPIIDVGVGTGIGLLSVLKLGSVVGVDGAIEMLRIAAQQVSEILQGPQLVSLVCASAEALPFRSQCFQTAVSITVIQNLSDTQQGIDELVRIVRPVGVLAVTSLARILPLQELESLIDVPKTLIKRLDNLANEDNGLIFRLSN